ncbi:hypothetical protein [Brevundimonas sp.]|uniref:hypothetical protein n=1 Tax=Brevundimonas sp. TaxID=1871086 RepID=UPI002EDB6B55
MATSSMIEKWAENERILRAVLEEHGSSISDGARALIEEWLDHNELGLAAETLRENISGPCSPLDQLLTQWLRSPSP